MAEQSSTLERQRTDLAIPKRYNVVIHNDDFTPMDWVVYILTSIFRKSEEDAVALMLGVHHGSKAVAGTYTRDVAFTKRNQAESMSREEGFPLRLTCEEA